MAEASQTRRGDVEIDYAARTRRRKRAWRDRRLRRRVVLLSIAMFVAMWLLVFVQLASGNDPALRRSLARRAARDSAQLRAELSLMTRWGGQQARVAAARLSAWDTLQGRLQQAQGQDRQLRGEDAQLRRQLAQAAGQLRRAAATATAARSNAGVSSAAGASSASTASTAAGAAAAAAAQAPPPAPSTPAPAPATASAAAAPAPPPAPAPAPVTTRSS
jgi:hypothetical protein